MTTHTVHPDISKQGLADNCPRCSEHATRLYDLDNEVLEDLLAVRDNPFRAIPGDLHSLRPPGPDLFAQREAEGQAPLPGAERISDATLARRRACLAS